jgi:hypothetical protein
VAGKNLAVQIWNGAVFRGQQEWVVESLFFACTTSSHHHHHHLSLSLSLSLSYTHTLTHSLFSAMYVSLFQERDKK